MNNFTVKFKLIFLPFVAIGIGTVGLYTLLHWLLIIKLNVVVIDEDWVNLFIPMGFVVVPLIIWLRPRLKLLKVKTTGKGDTVTGCLLITWVTVMASTCILQTYLEVATGKLTKLDHISQIAKLPKTKYYEVKHFYIDKRQVRVKTTFEVSGKHSEDFDMTIYTVSPVFDEKQTFNAAIGNKHIVLPDSVKTAIIMLNGKIVSANNLFNVPPDAVESIRIIKGKAAVALFGNIASHGALIIKTKTGFDLNAIDPPTVVVPVAPSAWVTLKYQKTIRNKIPADEKEAKYKTFAAESQRDFDAKLIEDFVYLDRIGLSKDEKNYLKAVRSKDSTVVDPVILTPVNEPFESRMGQKMPWVFASFGIGSVIFLLILLFIPLKDTTNTEPFEPVELASSEGGDLKNIFLPREGYYFTPIIINLNLIIYVAMVCAGLGFITFNGSDLLKWGGNYRPAIQNGEYWRLLTNVFLHGGLMHVLFNMYGLMFVGIFLEPLMGGKKYVIAYLFTGVLASLASVWWHPATVSVGASGAIFGMYGIFLALLTTNLFPSTFKKSFLVSTGIFVGYNLLFGLTGGIDNAAHIGGLVSGLLIGYALHPSLKQRAREADAEVESQRLLDEMTGKKEE